MSNTQSPKTMSYRICRTDNIKHLNGVITLVDFEDGTGIASVYVSETRGKNPVWHVSAELIEYSQADKHWFTPEPHERFNHEKQMWYFAELNNGERPSNNIGENGGDNGQKYNHYIRYDFRSINSITPKEAFQEDGTGTGGNSGE
ncbi:hypothetical protein GCM10011365_13100 [Marinicella pacifica]|uniref:Uncharacterized protein n=2 Tax=Marinicella pacifica TaxID=1171543 RepID=A0A917CP97_9GAMM|nr:hypothetical protein [Marinicella pacifica]GGF93235.1 hypothetical protein GCM10011365_13100 [Marinicella pacifica]